MQFPSPYSYLCFWRCLFSSRPPSNNRSYHVSFACLFVSQFGFFLSINKIEKTHQRIFMKFLEYIDCDTQGNNSDWEHVWLHGYMSITNITGKNVWTNFIGIFSIYLIRRKEQLHVWSFLGWSESPSGYTFFGNRFPNLNFQDRPDIIENRIGTLG